MLNGRLGDWVPRRAPPPVVDLEPIRATGVRRPGHARSDGQEHLTRARFPTTTRQVGRPPQPPPRRASIHEGSRSPPKSQQQQPPAPKLRVDLVKRREGHLTQLKGKQCERSRIVQSRSSLQSLKTYPCCTSCKTVQTQLCRRRSWTPGQRPLSI
jgi:hypothetical protein